MRKIISLGLAISVSLLFCAPISAQNEKEPTRVYVTAEDGLNIRKTPSTYFEPVDCVPYGTELQLMSDTNVENWSCIVYEDELRYVCNLYISEQEPAPLVVEQTESIISTGEYSPSDFAFAGVIYWGNYRWTWYSERVLPGYGLDIPGRYTDYLGYVRDQDGYLCLASNDLARGTIVDTPFGSQGKVYDCGCASGTLDVYVGW